MLVKQLAQINYPTAPGHTLYFAASDGTRAGLWRSDGTTSGTVLVKELEGERICGAAPCYLTNVAGTLFFAADHGTDFGLWRSDGSDAGTTPVKDGVLAYDLTAVGRTLYFATRDYSDSWLYRSDGTGAETVPIVSIGATPEGCYCGLEITGFPELTNVGGTLFFFGAGGLSRTDGTPNGTKLLRSGSLADQLTAAGKTLYFEGSDKKHGDELWRSDGTPRGDAACHGRPARQAQQQHLGPHRRRQDPLLQRRRRRPRPRAVEGRSKAVQDGQGEVQEGVGLLG